jgi:hypothetical protein
MSVNGACGWSARSTGLWPATATEASVSGEAPAIGGVAPSGGAPSATGGSGRAPSS